MEVDATRAARAREFLSAAASTDTRDLDESDRDVPILVIKGLHAKHRIDVDIWGDDVLAPALRSIDPRTRFVLWVHGDHVSLKTNVSIDVIANAVVAHLDMLKRHISEYIITFDPALAERATLLHEEAAK